MFRCGDGRAARGARDRSGAWSPLLWTKKTLVSMLVCSMVLAQAPAAAWADALQGAAAIQADAGATGDPVDQASVESSGTAGSAAAAEGAVDEQDASAAAEGAQSAAGQQEPAAIQQADAQKTEADAAAPELDAESSAEALSTETPEQQAVEPASPEASDGVTAADASVEATVSIIGPGTDGQASAWAAPTAYAMAQGETAADAIERILADAGLDAVISGEGDSWYLASIADPATGDQLGWDEATGRYWQLFVNGEAASTGAGSIELASGDEVALYYSAYGDALPVLGDEPGDDATDPEQVSASVAVIGPDAEGADTAWAETTSYELPQGSTAADLTERLLADTGLEADFGVGDWGWYLNAITSPFTGASLGYDAATGEYWQLYVNGVSASEGAGSIELASGDEIVWAYTAYGEELPSLGGDGSDTDKPGDELPPVDSDAERPDYDAEWNGFGNAGGGALVGVQTPTGAAEQAWAVDLKAEGEAYVSAGDPLIVNGDLYVSTSTELLRIDGTSGAIAARVVTGCSTTYFSRPVYADGVIVVPSDDGSLAAFTADTLTCVWRTPALDAPANGGRYQANSTLTVANGCVIAGFESGAGANGTATAGALVCVRVSDGAVMWTKVSVAAEGSAGEGYYWAGAAVSGDDIIIGDEGGRVQLIDASTGEVLSTVEIGMACRSTVVSAGSENGNPVFLAVGRQPATLFKIVREGDSLRLAGRVAFAASSTSTPVVADGIAYVGGSSDDFHGVLAAVDVASMTVVDTYRTPGTGEVKSSPLASVQDGETYVYFTSNSMPGSVYCYTASTGVVDTVFTPVDMAQQNYCTASVIADAAGNLYYTNDSGYLFCIRSVSGGSAQQPGDGQTGNGGAQVPQGGSGSGSGSGTVGGSVAPSKRPAGSVVPSARPVSAEGTDATADATGSTATALATEETDASTAKGGTARTGADADAGDAEATANDSAALNEETNPWAVAGIAVGVVGLAVLGGYLGLSRARSMKGGH